MNCADMEARIAEFLAGELEDRAAVEAHLLACSECRAAFSVARGGWEAAKEWKVEGPSGVAIATTLERMGGRSPHRGFVRVLQAGTLAASIVIAFVIGSSDRIPPGADSPAPPRATGPVSRPSTGLASVRPSVGLLYVQDENGRPAGELAIERLEVRVDIRDGIARTEIEEIFENRTGSRLEGTFQFPLPPDASISRLAMEIDGKLMEGEVVEREKARQTYEGIVRSMKDPALLEWMPGGIFQCRIFPIEPHSEKRIVIAYTQALSLFDHRGRYVYPLAGESARELGIGRFEFEATIRSGSKLVDAASTSHDATSVRIDERTMRTTFGHSDFRPRSDFVLAFESQPAGEIQVTAHRPAGTEQGYFAAFLTPRIDAEEARRRDRRLLFLLDVSGSVARAELEAARVVVRRMVRALNPDDRFRIGSHNLLVGAMPGTAAPDEEGKRAAERYLADLTCAGASDIAAALESAVALVPDHGELVYIGEGTPTWGEKDPAKIVEKLREAAGNRRISIRTVAVGSDAEKGLLETIAREFNGGSHAISPSDDVTLRADEIARTLGRSALTDLKVRFDGAVAEIAPATLGSLHFGERLLVTGRYGSGPVKLHLRGKVQDREIRREFVLSLPETEAGNVHVKRLWAQRKLADLVAQGEGKKAEVVKLSVESQVMTPYTSFLVLENEKAYEEHRIDRTKKDTDQSRDPRLAESRKLFQDALADYRARKLEDVVKKCDRILEIDPNHALAAEVKDHAQKDRHRQSISEPPIGTWAKGRSADPVKRERRRELELLFSQAQLHFEREQYPKCIEVCDRILHMDPRLSTVDQMKMIAQRLMHVKSDRDLTRTYLEQWKRSFESVDGFLQREEPSFSAREAWQEVIRQRRPKGILGVGEETPGSQVTTFEEEAKSQRGTIGKVIQETPVEQTANGGLAFTVGEGVPAQNPAREELEQVRQLLGDRTQIDFVEAVIPKADTVIFPTADEWNEISIRAARGSEVGPGFVTREGARLENYDLYTEPLHTLLRFDPQTRAGLGSRVAGVLSLDDIRDGGINRPFVGGYDIGGVGFTDEDEAAERLSTSLSTLTRGEDQSIRGLHLGLLKQSAELERLSSVGTLLDEYQNLSREQARLKEIIVNLWRGGEPSTSVPTNPLSALVTAVDPAKDVVAISVGRDAGAHEGDEFTILRGQAFIAKITLDRVDRAWATGRIVLEKDKPRIGDSATNNILAIPSAVDLMRVESIDGVETVLAGVDPRYSTVGTVVVLTRNGKYVATVQIKEMLQTKAKGEVITRLRAQQIEIGDVACRLDGNDNLWSLLPHSIRKDLSSESDLAAARRKLLLLRKGAGR